MTRRSLIAILIFLFCVALPTWVLSFFPALGGYGIYLLVFYPLIFLLGLLSGFIYYKFSDRIKLRKWLQVVLILVVDTLIICWAYPKGENSPVYQIKQAKQVVCIYGQLKPTDIFDATEKRNSNLITALYHKFKLPKETYTVTYCFFDSTGSCDTTFKTFHYFVKDEKIFTDNTSIHFALNLTEGSLTFTDTINKTAINFKVGYPDFGKYRKDFNNGSSDLTDEGEHITGLVKDIGNLRVMASENLPKSDYKFERLFDKYLDGVK